MRAEESEVHVATKRKTDSPVSVRIRGDQDRKLKELGAVTRSSVNSYVQMAVDTFIELEWETRMAKAKELEAHCAMLRAARGGFH